MSTPCYKCGDRKLACHDSCDRYKEFKKTNDEVKVARRKYSNSKGAKYRDHNCYTGM